MRSPLFYIKSDFYNIISSNSEKFHTHMSKKAQSDIRKRIQLSENPSQVSRLCLDGIEIKTISFNVKRMFETLVNLEYLTLNNCSLKSLDNFPHLPKLIVLQLSDNDLQGQDFNKLAHAAEITFLTLDNNNISNANNLKLLSCLPELQILQVHDNPFTNNFDYRAPLFKHLPSVKAIDCQDRQGNKVQQEDPSQYISFRQHRSHPNFDDFAGLEQDDEPNKLETIQQESQDKNMKRQPFDSLGGSIYSTTENHQRPVTDIMSMRTNFKEEQEDQCDKPLIRDFVKKMLKRQ